MLIDQVKQDMLAAMKAKDKPKLNTLRGLIAAVQTAETQGSQNDKLSDSDVEAIIRREAKQRVEAAEVLESGGESERAAAEIAEQKILEAYLPTPLSSEELETLVSDILQKNSFESASDMGAAMKAVNAEIAGRADGKTVATLVKSKLS